MINKPLPPKPLDPKTAHLRAQRLVTAKTKDPSPSRPPVLLTLKTKMPFGKHKGTTVVDIIEIEPSYIIWLAENTTLTIAADVELALQEAIDPRASPKAWESPKY